MTDLHFESATRLCAQLVSGDLSARVLLEVFIDRVTLLNRDLNALVAFDFEGARQRADSADAALRAGYSLGPLHGLPMSIKESFDFAGLPTTWGRPDLKENIASKTAVAAERLVAAGANIFGKTNVPLMCADWQTFNAVYGTTNNPWDITRVPGGSSGGSAAALASGMTPLELGSDIGASIRNPAHYCGVFGHKPTYGIVPLRGQSTPGILTPSDITVAGPMARSAEDLELALQIMQGPDQLDNHGWSLNLPVSNKRNLSDFRIAVMYEHPCCEVDDTIKSSIAELVKSIAIQGAHISETARPKIDLVRSHEIYIQLLRGTTHAKVPPPEFEKWLAVVDALGPDDTSFRGKVGRAATQRFRDWVSVNEERSHMRYAWDQFFGDYDVLICPAAASPAFAHDQKGDRIDRKILVNGSQQDVNDQLFWAGLGGVCYLPATVTPIKPSPGGLPIGLQIIGRSFGDLTTIQFAKCIEELNGGFKAPDL